MVVGFFVGIALVFVVAILALAGILVFVLKAASRGGSGGADNSYPPSDSSPIDRFGMDTTAIGAAVVATDWTADGHSHHSAADQCSSSSSDWSSSSSDSCSSSDSGGSSSSD